MPVSTSKRAPFKSGVRWFSLWDPQGKRTGYERHVVSAVSDGSATIETLTVYRTDAGLSEGVSTLAFGTGGVRLEAVRYQRDGVMGFSIRRDGETFSGYWVGKAFTKHLPPDFLPNFGFAEWVATLPQEMHGFWGFTRLPMGTDTPAPATIECMGEEEVKVLNKIFRAWKFVERVQGKARTTWWIDRDRNLVKYEFGLTALLEESEAAARTEITLPFPKPPPPKPAGTPIAGFDDPTKLMVEIPKNPVVASRQAGSAAAAVQAPSRLVNTTAPPAPAAPPAAPEAPKRPEHVFPPLGRPYSKELAERGPWKKIHRWYSLWAEGKATGWECHMVNPTGEGAMLETELHYMGGDGKWHDSAAVVVFGHNDRIANCHFMQDGVQTELGQPFFTLRRIETGFIGTWQGRPYKRGLPDDFVPGFGLHEFVATLPQTPGTKRTVQRLAMAQTELAPTTIECHGEQITEIRGEQLMLCKFVERIADKVRSIWWIDRERVIRKHFFGMEAIQEETEALAKGAWDAKS
ncbi:MAG: hypothetical protein HYY18_20225 [Planctomycetes bacterium]|nr:hypothetical protein [Planctomycetota bacterium]